jgi:hypothetical protein
VAESWNNGVNGRFFRGLELNYRVPARDPTALAGVALGQTLCPDTWTNFHTRLSPKSLETHLEPCEKGSLILSNQKVRRGLGSGSSFETGIDQVERDSDGFT